MHRKLVGRERRHKRVRKKIYGTGERPRLCVFRSAKHIYAQIVDDDKGATRVAFSSMAKDFARETNRGTNVEGAKMVGKELAKRALAVGISRVVFDRGGYIYHGRVKALADGAREGGLEF
ncbi:MAG TPA: 50S ribosomal protein L18 [bacterium]|nr:50S ribosomal protein L18 [bacterium]HPO07665.1 50S ribosomal protein L18 [bacterium]HQO33982.1 50S ribosomal protein L18 [bacterium]HQQ00316.1 50S ribosomal protein L18 [bacterium]